MMKIHIPPVLLWSFHRNLELSRKRLLKSDGYLAGWTDDRTESKQNSRSSLTLIGAAETADAHIGLVCAPRLKATSCPSTTTGTANWDAFPQVRLDAHAQTQHGACGSRAVTRWKKKRKDNTFGRTKERGGCSAHPCARHGQCQLSEQSIGD